MAFGLPSRARAKTESPMSLLESGSDQAMRPLNSVTIKCKPSFGRRPTLAMVQFPVVADTGCPNSLS